MLLEILNKIRDFYLYTIRPKFAEGIHTEYYFDEKIWDKIRGFPRKNQVTWYIITPANYEYVKHNLGTKLSKEELSELMSKRVKYMKKHGFDIELHIHFWQLATMPTSQKREIIEEAMKWGEKNGITFTKLTSGWRRIDKDLPDLCNEFGLKLKNRVNFTHDFEL